MVHGGSWVRIASGARFFPSFLLMQKAYYVLGNEQMKTVQNNIFLMDETEMNLIFVDMMTGKKVNVKLDHVLE